MQVLRASTYSKLGYHEYFFSIGWEFNCPDQSLTRYRLHARPPLMCKLRKWVKYVVHGSFLLLFLFPAFGTPSRVGFSNIKLLRISTCRRHGGPLPQNVLPFFATFITYRNQKALSTCSYVPTSYLSTQPTCLDNCISEPADLPSSGPTKPVISALKEHTYFKFR